MQSPTLATDAADSLGADRPDDRRNGRELADAVAANLTRLRRNSGLAIDDLATQSGLPQEYLVGLEAGRVIPTLRSLWVLAELFEVPFGVLISGAPCATTNFHVLRAGGSRIVDSADGSVRTRVVIGRTAWRWTDGDDLGAAHVWAAVFAAVLATALEVAAAEDPRASRKLSFDGQGTAMAVMQFLARPGGLTLSDAEDLVRDSAIGDQPT